MPTKCSCCATLHLFDFLPFDGRIFIRLQICKKKKVVLVVNEKKCTMLIYLRFNRILEHCTLFIWVSLFLFILYAELYLGVFAGGLFIYRNGVLFFFSLSIYILF